jgi:hypothetical protein
MVIRLVARDLDSENDRLRQILANPQSGNELFPFTPSQKFVRRRVDKARRF